MSLYKRKQNIGSPVKTIISYNNQLQYYLALNSESVYNQEKP